MYHYPLNWSINFNKLFYKIQDFSDSCHFFDAASPIIYGDSIDKELSSKLVDTTKEIHHILTPLDENEYFNFRKELIKGEQAILKDFEKESANFEACLPIEEIARRGTVQ